MPNFAGVLSALESERTTLERQLEQLTKAIRALEGLDGGISANRRRTLGRTRRRMSAAGRARIAAAQRARWAKVKKQKPENVTPMRVMSAAARRKIAAAQRRRWAKVKKAA